MKTLCKILSIALLGCLLFQCLSCSNVLKNLVRKIELEKPLGTAEPTLDSLARHAGSNLGAGLADNAEIIGKKLVKGLKEATDTLDPDIQRIMRKIDSIGNLSNDKLLVLANTLRYQIKNIKGDVTDKEFSKSLVGIVEQLTGKLRDDTKDLLAVMIQDGLSSLGSDSTKVKVDKIITNLLSDTLTIKAQSLVTKALQPTIDSLEKKIDRIVNKVNKDVGVLQKYAGQWLLLLGLVACVIIGFVWYQRRRYAKLLKILTLQIERMPEPAYKEVTKRIQSQAQEDGLETMLRRILKAQGLKPEMQV